MSLATRCGACGTVFRVVQDQLRVSAGWVRCGRCAQVFNAIENLVDLENDRSGELPAAGSQGELVFNDLARVAGSPDRAAAEETDAAGAAERTGSEADGAPAEAAGAVQAPAEPSSAPSHSPLAAAAMAAIDQPGPDPGDRAALAPQPVEHAASIGADLRGAARMVWTQPPRFVRQAERAARWRHPAVRALLSLVALMLAALLAAQAMLAWHDSVAHRWPGLAPWVERLCSWQGCRIEAPRQIDRLTVDSSGLVRSGPSGVYRLTAVIRNRDTKMAVRAPAIDLTLSDAGGRSLARRVLDPHELGAPAGPIPAGAEWMLNATLRSRAGDVAGYTIELFYP